MLVFEEAMADGDFVGLLREFYQSRPTSRTLAEATVVGNETLLGFCVWKGYTKCVKLLLDKYAPGSCAAPWLELANPVWQDRKYGDSAFLTAAACGHPEILKLLFKWQEEKSPFPLDKVLTQRKRKNFDMLETVRFEIKKRREANAADGLWNVRTYYDCDAIVAPYFGLEPLPIPDAVSQQPYDAALATRPVLVIDVTDSGQPAHTEQNWTQRKERVLPSTTMTFAQLSAELEREPLPDNCRILCKDLHVVPETSPASVEQEKAAGVQFFKSLGKCLRFSIRKSDCVQPEVFIALIHGFHTVMRDTASSLFDSFLVEISPVPESDWSNEQRDSLAKVVRAFLETLLTDENLRHSKCKSWDVHRLASFLPQAERYLRGLLFVAMNTRGWAVMDEVVQVAQAGAGARNFNPFLHAACHVETYFLKQKAMFEQTRAHNEGADPPAEPDQGKLFLEVLGDDVWKSWTTEVTSVLFRLAKFLRGASDWNLERREQDQQRVTTISAAHQQIILQRFPQMIDEAIVFILKMRPKSGRAGLDGVVEAVRAGLGSLRELSQLLPVTREYMDRRNLL